MTLEEAILHAEEVADSKERKVVNGDWEKGSMTECDCIECAKEHRQLAEWLKELKQYREAMEVIKFEIDKKTVIHADGELYIKNIDVKRIINRYVSRKEKEEWER